MTVVQAACGALQLAPTAAVNPSRVTTPPQTGTTMTTRLLPGLLRVAAGSSTRAPRQGLAAASVAVATAAGPLTSQIQARQRCVNSPNFKTSAASVPSGWLSSSAASFRGDSLGFSSSSSRVAAKTGPIRARSSYASAVPSYDVLQIEEVEWDKSLVNNVVLLGRVPKDPTLAYTKTGKAVASFSIGQDNSDGTTMWFNVTCWDDIAKAVASQILKGSVVTVSGRLRTETFQDRTTNQPRSAVKIVATDVKRVLSSRAHDDEGGYGGRTQTRAMGRQSGQYSPPPQAQAQSAPAWAAPQAQATSSASAAPPASKVALWNDLRAKPEGWYDNRTGKTNSKAPDFKHKSSGTGLWVSGRDTPEWVAMWLNEWDSQGGRISNHNNAY